jgi:hypothetical protein
MRPRSRVIADVKDRRSAQKRRAHRALVLVEVWGSLWRAVESLLASALSALALPENMLTWSQAREDRDESRWVNRDWIARQAPPKPT